MVYQNFSKVVYKEGYEVKNDVNIAFSCGKTETELQTMILYNKPDNLDISASLTSLENEQLCKVSEYEISQTSKHQLAFVADVSWKTRVKFWLYKHDFAHPESVCRRVTENGDFLKDTASNVIGDDEVQSPKNSLHVSTQSTGNNHAEISMCNMDKYCNSEIKIKEFDNTCVDLKWLESGTKLKAAKLKFEDAELNSFYHRRRSKKLSHQTCTTCKLHPTSCKTEISAGDRAIPQQIQQIDTINVSRVVEAVTHELQNELCYHHVLKMTDFFKDEANSGFKQFMEEVVRDEVDVASICYLGGNKSGYPRNDFQIVNCSDHLTYPGNLFPRATPSEIFSTPNTPEAPLIKTDSKLKMYDVDKKMDSMAEEGERESSKDVGDRLELSLTRPLTSLDVKSNVCLENLDKRLENCEITQENQNATLPLDFSKLRILDKTSKGYIFIEDFGTVTAVTSSDSVCKNAPRRSKLPVLKNRYKKCTSNESKNKQKPQFRHEGVKGATVMKSQNVEQNCDVKQKQSCQKPNGVQSQNKIKETCCGKTTNIPIPKNPATICDVHVTTTGEQNPFCTLNNFQNIVQDFVVTNKSQKSQQLVDTSYPSTSKSNKENNLLISNTVSTDSKNNVATAKTKLQSTNFKNVPNNVSTSCNLISKTDVDATDRRTNFSLGGKNKLKMSRGTKIFEHIRRSNLHTLRWVHNNLFDIEMRPHTLVIHEEVKNISESSVL